MVMTVVMVAVVMVRRIELVEGGIMKAKGVLEGKIGMTLKRMILMVMMIMVMMMMVMMIMVMMVMVMMRVMMRRVEMR